MRHLTTTTLLAGFLSTLALADPPVPRPMPQPPPYPNVVESSASAARND